MASRPDAAIPIVLIFTYFLFVTFASRPPVSALIYSLLATGIFCIFVVGYEVFRLKYYGEILPNTYTLKLVGMPIATRLKNGLGYVNYTLKPHILVFILGGFNLLIAFRRQTLLFVSAAIASIFYLIWVGGDVYHGGRMILPSMPLMLALCVHNAIIFAELVQSKLDTVRYISNNYIRVKSQSLKWLLKMMLVMFLFAFGILIMLVALDSERSGLRGSSGFAFRQTILATFGSLLLLAIAPFFIKRHLISFLSVALTLILMLNANGRFVIEMVSKNKAYFWNTTKHLTNLGVALDQLTTPDATIGVEAAGIIPYLSGRTSYDFLGKSDRYVARLDPDLSGAISWDGMISVPGHNKYDLDYSIKVLCPTYIERFKYGKQDLSEYAKTHYVPVQYKGVTLWLRKNSRSVLWDKIDRSRIESSSDDS